MYAIEKPLRGSNAMRLDGMSLEQCKFARSHVLFIDKLLQINLRNLNKEGRTTRGSAHRDLDKMRIPRQVQSL